MARSRVGPALDGPAHPSLRSFIGGGTDREMKAVQLDAPGPPEALHLRDLPMPQPSAGWVRIRVEAFGLNRSELYLRLGLAEGVTFPRVPGIECAGVVDAAPGTAGTTVYCA